MNRRGHPRQVAGNKPSPFATVEPPGPWWFRARSGDSLRVRSGPALARRDHHLPLLSRESGRSDQAAVRRLWKSAAECAERSRSAEYYSADPAEPRVPLRYLRWKLLLQAAFRQSPAGVENVVVVSAECA